MHYLPFKFAYFTYTLHTFLVYHSKMTSTRGHSSFFPTRIDWWGFDKIGSSNLHFDLSVSGTPISSSTLWWCWPLPTSDCHVLVILKAFKSFNNGWHPWPVFGVHTYAVQCQIGHLLCSLHRVLPRKPWIHDAAQPPATS